jgi:hypothetical protein
MTPSKLIKVRLEKKPSWPLFHEAKIVSGGNLSAIHRAASYLAMYSFEVKFMLLTNIYVATAKSSRLKPIGAHLKTRKRCLAGFIYSEVKRAIRDSVIIQKINEGERYHIKYKVYCTPDMAI